MKIIIAILALTATAALIAIFFLIPWGNTSEKNFELINEQLRLGRNEFRQDKAKARGEVPDPALVKQADESKVKILQIEQQRDEANAQTEKIGKTILKATEELLKADLGQGAKK